MALGLSAAAAAERPNIVVLFADDMGFSDIGCFGSEIETPNLDALAANGLRFTQFYNTGRCCPSRASILTGLYSHQAGIGHMAGETKFPAYRDRLSSEAVTLAEVIGEAGYHTIMTGKWHLGWRRDNCPTARGFDKFYGTRGYIDSYYTIVARTEVYLGDQLVLPVTDHPVNHLRPDQEWYTTDVFTDYALHFIDEHREESTDPFFLYLAYNAPHFPLHAKPEDIDKYRGKYREGWQQFREQRHRALIEAGILKKDWDLSPPAVDPWDSLTEKQRDDLDFKMALFAAIVDRLDQNVGRVVDHLRDIGELDNTLIVFVSDNGGTKEKTLFGIKGDINTVDNYNDWARKGGWSSSYGQGWAGLSNAPFRRYKRENHEGGISAPAIVHWPDGIEARGELRHQVAHLIDLMPTVVEASGAKYPKQFKGHAIQPMEGQSLLPAFASTKTEPRTLYFEHEGNRAIRDGDFKLVGSAGGPWELYDMRKDRSELNDLSKANTEKFTTLKTKWDTWADKVGVVDPKVHKAARQEYNNRRNEARKKKAAEAPSPPEGKMNVPGKLLFSEDFNPKTVSERWGYKASFALRGGGLQRTEVDPTESKRVFLKDPEFHNTVIQFDFKFARQTTELRLVTGSGGGYNSVTEIRPGHFQVNTPVDRAAGIVSSNIGDCPREYPIDQWQTMTVEYFDDEILAYLGDEEFVLGRHPIIDRTRRYFAFQFDLPGATIDNVRVWEAKAQRDDWPATRKILTKTQSKRPPVWRNPAERYKLAYTNLKSRLTLEDQAYRDLVKHHGDLQAALRSDHPQAFKTHKELRKSIAAKKKLLKANDPDFKSMESPVFKARKAEDAHVVSTKPALADLPKHRYPSELGQARLELETQGDKQLAALVAETAKRQAALEKRFPEAFASVDKAVDQRKTTRQSLNDDPAFKARNQAVADASHAIKDYENEADRNLALLKSASKTYLDLLGNKK